MSKFSELLSRPLPSACNNDNDDIFTEGFDNTFDDLEGCKKEGCGKEACGEEGCDETDDTDPFTTPNPEIPQVSDETTPLTPEEDKRVDQTINAVATPVLIKDELKSEGAIEEFVESTDCAICEAEGFLTERTIVKFDKNAKKAQLYEVAVAAVAREKQDPLYKKLETVYKMERVIKAKLRKKYHAEASRKVKEYLARAKKSKSSVLSRIAHKITGK